MSENGELIVPDTVSTEAERKAYFQPFEDESGVKRCGGPRQRCSNCKHQYTQSERFTLRCPQCGFDRRCRGTPKRGGNGRCRRHGGKNKSGTEAANYRHGKYASKAPWFPKEVQTAYEKAQKSADMDSIVSEYCLVQARLILVAANIKDATKWRDDLLAVVDEIDKYRGAAQAGDAAAANKVAAAVDRLMQMVRDGAEQADWWDDALSLNDRSAQLKMAHSTVERNHSAVLSATQAINFVRLISQGVKEALLLVKGRVATMRTALLDEVEIGRIIEDSAEQIEGGADAREVMKAAFAEFTKLVPIDDVQGSFSEANDIVQGRIKQLIE